uniref:DAGKc domain-containing protein n=1 Tax=Caenorhabditis japonica TaxID=281687 RepID=A0A8R1IAR4_CAEJA
MIRRQTKFTIFQPTVHFSGSAKHLIIYRLDELLCTTCFPLKIKKGVPIIPTKPTTSDKTLYFNFVYKKDKKKWRLKQIPVVFYTTSERDYWHSLIDTTLRRVKNRPKNIIIFINPFGGKGKAQKIFKDNVEAFFWLTPGLRYKVMLTERANHARDFIVEMPPEQWTALDGL